MINSKITNEIYSKLPNLVLGFHGCSKIVYVNVIKNGHNLRSSSNKYDWLGNGIYFWENSYERAYEWAYRKYKTDARVLGAVIDLGECLNLTDYNSKEILKTGYELYNKYCAENNIEMAKNRKSNFTTDILLRDLDCAVIQFIHQKKKEKEGYTYDSVRGVFTEGKEMYPGSALLEKTHIQLCIVNPNCIKGYFEPIEYNKSFRIP